MLSTDLSTVWAFLLVVSWVFWLGLAVWCWKAARYSMRAAEYVQEQNKRSLGLRRMAEVETTLTELLDSYNALMTSHKKLRARIGMRAGREKRNNGQSGDVVPSDEAGRAAYKTALRADAKAKGLLR
jgi:hypothetical protein